MAFTLIAGAAAVALFFGMLGLQEYGFRRGRAPCDIPRAVLAIVVYVITALEFPRFGLIRRTDVDRFLAATRDAMR